MNECFFSCPLLLTFLKFFKAYKVFFKFYKNNLLKSSAFLEIKTKKCSNKKKLFTFM